MDPQSCSQCNEMPEDILMLACSHDLCLNCAADRLAFEMKRKKNPNSIACQLCHERTPLDGQSITQLQKILSHKKLPPLKGHTEASNRSGRDQKVGSHSYNNRGGDRYQGSKIGGSRVSQEYEYNRGQRNNSSGVAKQAFQGIPSNKQCNEHPQEQILYFCFDCRCECICPQCVIHGKHKDHDVKTIRKSQPMIKGEIQSYMSKSSNNIEGLMIKKSEIQKEIKSITDQNNVTKRQIQQAFDDLRTKIANQEKQIVSKCDDQLRQNLSEYDNALNTISKKVQDSKNLSLILSESLKKQDILLLNFYSRRYRQLDEQCKEFELTIEKPVITSVEPILSAIMDVGDQVDRISMSFSGKQRTSRYNS